MTGTVARREGCDSQHSHTTTSTKPPYHTTANTAREQPCVGSMAAAAAATRSSPMLRCRLSSRVALARRDEGPVADGGCAVGQRNRY
eukprot:scaffold9549_cov57-Phaeocystis_antarctica.AAC.3